MGAGRGDGVAQGEDMVGQGAPLVRNLFEPGKDGGYVSNASLFFAKNNFPKNAQFMTRHRKNPPTPKPETEVADSLKAAASILKVPIAVLQKLKASGCPGFRNGRVHLDEVRSWLTDPKNSESMQADPEDIDTAKLAVLIQRARLLRIRADQEEGLLVPLAEVRRVYTQAVVGAKTRLLRIPRRCAQRVAAITDWVQIEEILDTEIFDALESMHRGEWLHAEHCETCGRSSEAPTEVPEVETTNPVKVSSK